MVEVLTENHMVEVGKRWMIDKVQMVIRTLSSKEKAGDEQGRRVTTRVVRQSSTMKSSMSRVVSYFPPLEKRP
jgi:hypothetical protein